MALRKCPECGKDVSDKANTCPNCGFTLNYAKSNTVRTIARLMIIIGLIMIGISATLSLATADSRMAISLGVATYSEWIKYKRISAIENIALLIGAFLLIVGLIVKIFFKSKNVKCQNA